MLEGVTAFLMSGQFWFAEFLALLFAFTYTGFFGYSPGPNLGNYARFNMEDWKAWSEFGLAFLVISAFTNVVVFTISAVISAL